MTRAIKQAWPREAKHNNAGCEEWVDRILNQREGYRLAHNWRRGTPKVPPPPPTSATIDGQHDGHP
eukprot:9648641-Karenia_brevis.AAC.1